MKETIKYAFSLGANLIKFSIVFPLPGSQNYNYLKEKHGIKRIDWSGFDISNSPYPMSYVPSKKLSKTKKMLDYRSHIYNNIKRLRYLFGVK